MREIFNFHVTNTTTIFSADVRYCGFSAAFGKVNNVLTINIFHYYNNLWTVSFNYAIQILEEYILQQHNRAGMGGLQ